MTTRSCALLLGTASLLAGTAARAQEAVDLGTIVFYGGWTAETVADSTASVAVADAEDVSSATVRTYRDLFDRMANVSTGDWTESGFVLRGVNSEGLTPGGVGAPLASLYVDGVQQTVEASRRGFRGTFDLEQVEVYRGPQSTERGRAALAGAIYLRSTDPTFEPSGRAQLTLGENGRRQAGLAYGSAISETLAFRLSGEWSERENDLNYPSYERFDRYDDFVVDDFYNLRGKLLWEPDGTGRTQVLLSYSHSYDSPTPDDIAGSAWSSAAPGYDAERGDIWGDILPDFYAGFGLTELPVFQDVRDTTVDSAGLELRQELSDALRLTALLGWNHSVTDRNSINEGTEGEVLVVSGEFDQELVTAEARLDFESAEVEWVVGAYAAVEEQGSFRDQQLFTFDQSRNTARIENLALFAGADFHLTPAWTVITGLRADWIGQDQTAFYAVDGTVTADTESSFDGAVLIPRFGLQYGFGEGQTVALVYQEGYRPGGSGIRTATGTEYSYDEETARTVELSWRGSFLQGRLGVAANAFHQAWNGQQVEVWEDPLDSSTSIIANAGSSTSRGAELELSFAATSELDLFASLGLLDTEFDDFVVGSTDYAGLPFPGAPERSLAVGARWERPEGWFAEGTLTYSGSFMSRLEQGVAEPLFVDGHTVLDLAAGRRWGDLTLTLYAANALDAEYVLYEYGPDALATLGERREVGVRIDYAF